MKRILSVLCLGALAAGILSGCGIGGTEEAVSVQSVSMITGMGAVGMVDRYAGMVVSGQTAEIQKDENKTILEVYVEEGDMVEEGDILFAYDTEALQLDLDKLYLEKQSYENTIAAAKSEIEELKKQKANASSSQQLSYTLQINAREADIREAEYNLALKEREILAMEEGMENTEITTPLSGRIMTVNTGENSDNYGENTNSFITVMDVSSYRVEGHINELNLYSLPEGTPVLIRSRIDDTATWTGVVDSIDWENPVTGNNNNMFYMGPEDEMTSSSKYPFYVTLDHTEGLILGQHIYIEPDYGQDVRSGLVLPGYFIMDTDSTPWVWAASARGTLEKRSVTLGAYDPDMDEYEILSGIGANDYLAFPEEQLKEGMPVSYYDDSGFEDAPIMDMGMVAPAGGFVVSEPFIAEVVG